jgi:hypothetical protein
MPYPVVYRFTEGAAVPVVSAGRAAFVEGMDDTLARLLVDAFVASPGEQTMFQVRVLGGAVGDVAPDATAYAHRKAGILVMGLAMAASAERLAAMEAWADGVLDGLRGHATGTYVNFLADEGEARVREAYTGATFERLAAVKAAWDPENVFRRNQNVPPAS